MAYGDNAIVCTLFMPSDNVEPVRSFLSFHLAIGFDHIFLFIDSPTDEAVSSVAAQFGESVTAFGRSDTLLAEQKALCTLYPAFSAQMESDVPSRQMLNAEYASILATRRGFKWLLHIDIDELFYLPYPVTLDEHLASIEREGFYSVSYMNHEGVPEGFDCTDYFETTTLFRRHYFGVALLPEVESCLEFWRNRTAHRQYMLVYDNGKSIVRLPPAEAIAAGASHPIPQDVHRWRTPSYSCGTDGPGRPHGTVMGSTFIDPRHLEVLPLTSLGDRYSLAELPCILHYVTCGYRWLVAKYLRLGRFPNHWLGGKLPIPPSFHLDARDAINETPRSGHRYAAAFYLSQVCLLCSDLPPSLHPALLSPQDLAALRGSTLCSDNTIRQHIEERDRQLRAGVLMRMGDVTEYLTQVATSEGGRGHFSLEQSRDIMRAVRRTYHEQIATQTKSIRVASAGPPATAATTASSGVSTLGVDSMSKLRILSRAALDFL